MSDENPEIDDDLMALVPDDILSAVNEGRPLQLLTLIGAIVRERDAAKKDVERLEFLVSNEAQVWECNGRYSVHAVSEHNPITDDEYSSARADIDAAILDVMETKLASAADD